MADGDHIGIIKKAVEDYLAVKLASAEPVAVVTYEGTSYTEPAGDWFHIDVIHNCDHRVALNAREYEALGLVRVFAMVPQRTGKLRVKQMAGRVMALLADRQIPAVAEGVKSVTLRNAKYRERGVVAGRETINVDIEYRAFYLLNDPV